MRPFTLPSGPCNEMVQGVKIADYALFSPFLTQEGDPPPLEWSILKYGF